MLTTKIRILRTAIGNMGFFNTFIGMNFHPMKHTVLQFIAITVFTFLFGCSDKKAVTTKTGTSIILAGTYNGNNLFVKNPPGADGFGFCVNEIIVNGNRTSDEIMSENIEIDLKASGVREGHEITIEIKHYPGCEPTILNPQVLD